MFLVKSLSLGSRQVSNFKKCSLSKTSFSSNLSDIFKKKIGQVWEELEKTNRIGLFNLLAQINQKWCLEQKDTFFKVARFFISKTVFDRRWF